MRNVIGILVTTLLCATACSDTKFVTEDRVQGLVADQVQSLNLELSRTLAVTVRRAVAAEVSLALAINPRSLDESNDRTQLRTAHSVRPLNDLENDLPLSGLPNGVFGFTVPWLLESESRWNVPLSSANGGTQVVEIHKLPNGDVQTVGYLREADVAALSSDASGKVWFFPQSVPDKELAIFTSIPLHRVTAAESSILPSGAYKLLLSIAPMGSAITPEAPQLPMGAKTFIPYDASFSILNASGYSAGTRFSVLVAGSIVCEPNYGDATTPEGYSTEIVLGVRDTVSGTESETIIFKGRNALPSFEIKSTPITVAADGNGRLVVFLKPRLVSLASGKQMGVIVDDSLRLRITLDR